MLPLGGYRVVSTTADHLTRTLAARMDAKLQTALVFANTNFIVQCRALRARLNKDPVLIVNDGLGMDLAAKLVHGRTYSENLNGSDFVPYFLARRKRLRVFLFGGRPGVADAAASYIERLGHRVVGIADGYGGNTPEVWRRVNAASAEVLLVALGNPKQERWILEHAPLLDAKLIIGVGALFDFAAGMFPRAPRWVRRMRCEWLFRLSREPRRLLRRYTVDVAVFLVRCIKNRNHLPADAPSN